MNFSAAKSTSCGLRLTTNIVRSASLTLTSRATATTHRRPSIAAQASSKDEGALAVVTLIAAPIMLFSEWTLKSTGCGLPSGPGGLYGAAEGISYLWVTGIVAWSVYTKVKTGKGLPEGPYGLLGAAEGLSYLTILAGIIVLGFQIADYGYLPNAIPVEGGKCQ